MPNYELEDLCETGIPDRLARSRMFRPKKVRPLKEPVSGECSTDDHLSHRVRSLSKNCARKSLSFFVVRFVRALRLATMRPNGHFDNPNINLFPYRPPRPPLIWSFFHRSASALPHFCTSTIIFTAGISSVAYSLRRSSYVSANL